MDRPRKPQVFRPERAEGPFDAIVIGSGMGGLTVAALLAKAGKRVLVLERHYAMGGFTHTFRRREYEWDVGVHYVGEFHRDGTLPNLLIDDITERRLRWAPMPANYDRMIFPDRSYDFVSPRERFIEELAGSFPHEKEALVRYVDRVREVGFAAMKFFQHKALPRFLRPWTRPFFCPKFLSASGETTATALSRLTGDQKLVGVLTGQWGTYGLPPGESSFGIHALIASHYLGGAAYPVGGSASIAASIVPTIESSGGTLLIHADVEEILIRNGRTHGVRLRGGEEVAAPLVISDAGVINTFGRLVGGKTRKRLGMDSGLAGLRPSASHVCLYVGLKESAEQLGLRPTNLWIYPGYDHDRNVREFLERPDAPLPVAYVSFPSAKDPSWEERRGPIATLEVIGIAPYEWFEPWQDERWRKRGKEYEELKARHAERLLQALYDHVPQTRGKVDYHELSTPLSTRHFANYSRGEIYGLSFGPDRFKKDWLGPRTAIRGLYLTGQDVLAHGVVGAMYGGLVAASVILGRNVVKDVRRRRSTLPAMG